MRISNWIILWNSKVYYAIIFGNFMSLTAIELLSSLSSCIIIWFFFFGSVHFWWWHLQFTIFPSHTNRRTPTTGFSLLFSSFQINKPVISFHGKPNFSIIFIYGISPETIWKKIMGIGGVIFKSAEWNLK